MTMIKEMFPQIPLPPTLQAFPQSVNPIVCEKAPMRNRHHDRLPLILNDPEPKAPAKRRTPMREEDKIDFQKEKENCQEVAKSM